ncbi:hypothetical protein [Billgrantia desiderata]|uniref:hypothetical protein n=1 Tax=Billgrantia desiderata TaxID=52021 RepID=UPI00089E7900|nr:hypothetical protein [Halomonas desiderata]SEG18182.1 hypothetical protein SAMN04487953_11681 [Halomonas desiderata]
MDRWRKYKTNGESPIILVPDSLEPVPDKSQKRNKYSQLAAWVGALSQAAMLLVVLFGYIYTVRPVFQHQLLQEKLASAELSRLEVESQTLILQAERDEAEKNLQANLAEAAFYRLEIEEQIKILQDERDQAETSLHDVKSQIVTVELQQEMLEEELQESRQRAQQAMSRASQLEGLVQEQLRELENARWELLMIDFSFSRIFSDMAISSLEGWGGSFPEYLQQYRNGWPDPFSGLKSSIEELRGRNVNESRYPENYINEFAEFIDSRQDRLTCDSPPFDDLNALFQEKVSQIDFVVKNKTDEYIDGLVEEYRGRGQRVRITDEFRDRTARMYRVTEEYDVNRELKEVVEEYLRACRLVAQNVIDEFEDIKGVVR